MRLRTGLIYLGIALIGAALVYEVTREHGIALSVDSVKYVSTAESLLDGEGFMQFDGLPYTLWPPLYPMTLAGAGWAGGGDLLAAARWLHITLFALVVLASAFLFRRLTGSDLHGGVAALALVGAYPVVRSAVLAQSELSFILLVVLFVSTVGAYASRPRVSLLLVAALLAGAAVIQRYAGVALIGAGGLVILAAPGAGGLRRRVAHAASFGVLSSIPFGVWLTRNRVVTGTWMGERLPPPRTLIRNAEDVLDTVSAWFFPQQSLPLETRLELLAIGFAAVIVCCAAGVWLRRDREPEDRRASNALAITALVVVVVYVAFLLASSSVSFYGRLNHRYLSPVYIPLFALVWLGTVNLCRGVGRVFRAKRVGHSLPVLLLGAWIAIHPIGQMERLVRNLLRGGMPGYTSRDWTESPMIAWLRENPLEGTVYTNSPEAMYILCDVRAQEILTRLSHPTKVEAAATVEEAGAIVWFAPFRSRQPLPKGSFEDFEKYGQGVEVLPLETFVDGAVFRVREP